MLDIASSTALPSCGALGPEGFDATVSDEIEAFLQSRLLDRVRRGTVTIAHYRTLLCTLFHQTYSSPYTFARAAVHCTWRHEAAKEYLLQHAEEERTHWRWVLNDLAATDYSGPNLRATPPHITAQAYIGLNYYIAEHYPIARLAVAAVIEGIGARYGAIYGKRLLELLCLKPSQASFFLSHADTDTRHIVELRNVIEQCDLTGEEWLWMNHAARTASTLYRAMYDHDGYASV